MDVISELIHYHSLNQFSSKHKAQHRAIIFVHKVKISLFKERFYKSFFEVTGNTPLVMDSLPTAVIRGAMVSR